jgi:hypothetical protein
MKLLIIILSVIANIAYSQTTHNLIIKYSYNVDTIDNESKKLLYSLLEQYKPDNIDIVIECSSCPIGTEDYNYDLVNRRLKYLTKTIRNYYNLSTLRIEVINNGEGLSINDRKCVISITSYTEFINQKKLYIIFN